MLRIRSSTLFQLLCWSIGILAAALLGLVGVMIWPYIFPPGPASAAVQPKPAPAKGPTTTVSQALRTMHDRFWPEVTQEQQAGFSDAKPSGAGYRYVGSIIYESGKGCAILQKESDLSQILVSEDMVTGDIKVKKLSKDLLALEINGQRLTLQKVDAAAPRMPGRPAVGRPPVGPPAAAASRPITATSYRMAASTPAAATPTAIRGVPSTTVTLTSRATSVTTTTAGQPTPATGVAPSSTSGRNWRQYWAERTQRNNSQPRR